MPNKLNLTCILVIAGILISLFGAFSFDSTSANHDPTKPKSADSDLRIPGTPSVKNPTAANPTVDTSNTDPRFTRFTDGTIHLTQSFTTSRRLHSSPDPRTDLELVTQLLSDYRLVYQENPVGTENAEIVAQLLGSNPKKTFFIDPALSALNASGELLDRWGSPFVFHPLKSDLMDIRSLGPDKTIWTADDLSLDVKNVEAELRLGPEQ